MMHLRYIGQLEAYIEEDRAGKRHTITAILPRGEVEEMYRRLSTGPRDERQRRVLDWACAAFTVEQAMSLPQRGARLAEEAIEAAQAAETPREMVHRLVDYVYDRPAGDLRQELGGVGVTVLALAESCGYSADDAETDEINRITSKPLEHFRARNQAKNDAGFDATLCPPKEPNP